MDKIIYSTKDNITIDEFGGKNYWLSFLSKKDYLTIPKTYLIPSSKAKECKDMTVEDFEREFNGLFGSSTLLAIRSSGLSEDGNKESKAGNFHTGLRIPNEAKLVLNEIEKCLSSSKDEMGVVIQEFIESSYSGVVFSTNPLTSSKNEFVLAYKEGDSEELMSGTRIDNKDCILKYDDDAGIEETPFPNQLKELRTIIKTLESEKGFPLDIEWCIEKNTGALYIVQCRPLTGVLFERNEIIPITEEYCRSDEFFYHEKTSIRKLGFENGIDVSKGWIVRCNCLDEEFPIDEFEINVSDKCTGLSAVILYPERINGDIIRKFIDHSNNKQVIKCNRYGIRATPTVETLGQSLNFLYQMAHKHFWNIIVIIQEIYDPYVTGIAKKSNDNLVIDTIKGHFAAKGIYPANEYLLNSSYEIIHERILKQKKFMLIRKGSGIELENNDDGFITALPDQEVIKIGKQLSTILKDDNNVVEFGVIQNGDSFSTYLIDVNELNSLALPKEDEIKAGVISKGKITGKIVRVKSDSMENAIDVHFRNNSDFVKQTGEATIYVCDIPSINLLSILQNSNGNIGFVFKNASLLCHFSVLLREKHIPAISGIDPNSLSYDSHYSLNTDISGDAYDKFKPIQ